MKLHLETTFNSNFIFQPIYSVEDELLAVELNIRFNSDDGKLSMPTELALKRADSAALTALLDEMIDWAQQHADWFAAAEVALNIPVNQRMAEVIVHKSAVDLRAELMALPFVHLVIDESFPRLSEGKRNRLLALLSQNFTLWLDNFGSGQASMTPLFDGLFAYVRIDKNFFGTLLQGNKLPKVLPALLNSIQRFCRGVAIRGLDNAVYVTTLNEISLQDVPANRYRASIARALGSRQVSPMY